MIEATTLQDYIRVLTGTITPSDVLLVLSVVVGVGMAFVLMWLGVRLCFNIFLYALWNYDLSRAIFSYGNMGVSASDVKSMQPSFKEYRKQKLYRQRRG